MAKRKRMEGSLSPKEIEALELHSRLTAVREAVAESRGGLKTGQDRKLLEELLADAAGWKMELEGMGAK